MRSIFAGGTDYRGQSINDIKKDLIDTRQMLVETVKQFNINIEKIKSYDKFKSMDYDFRASTFDLIQFFNTSIDDIDFILDGMNSGLNNVHINLLKNMHKLSHEKNKHHRKSFRQYDNPEYGEPYFDIIEDLYRDGGDVTASMFDLGNMIERMQQFIIDKGNEMSINISNNIGKVENLQQNSGNAVGYQYSTHNSRYEDVDRLIESLKEIAESLEKHNKEELLEYIEDFSEDMNAVTPRKSRIKSAWDSIKSMLTLSNIASVATISTSIPNIIDMGEKIVTSLK